MKSLGAFAVAALFCVTPVSPHWSQGNGPSVAVASADAADLSIPPRHRAVRYGRLYDPYCNGPYTNNWNVGFTETTALVGTVAPIAEARGCCFTAMA